MTINVCLASQLFHPYYAGGALRYMRYLPGLAKRNIDITVFTGTPSNQRALAFNIEKSWEQVAEGEFLPITEVSGSDIYRIRLPNDGARRRNLKYGSHLLKFSTETIPNFDLVQYLPLSLWLTPSLIRLRRKKIPIISTYNLLDANQSNKLSYQSLSRRLPLQFVDTIIVQSKIMRDSLQELGVKTPVEIIPNGVDLEQYQPINSERAKVELRQKLGLPINDVLLITVGSVEPRKGIDQLLEAWNQIISSCPRTHLIIVGPRPDLENPAFNSFHQKLEDLLDQLGSREYVHFVGKVDNVADYLKAADLFVFASWREGLPNVVLEAMATGLPVLTMPFSGLSVELGQPDKHYCLVDRDPVQFGTVLKQFIFNPDLRHQIGSSGLKWVQSHMDMNHVLDQYVTLYQRMSNR